LKITTIAGGALLAMAWVGTLASFGATRIVNRIVARVNNDIITQRQFEREEEKLRADLGQQYSGSELEVQYNQQRNNLLRNLIDEDLMVQKAKDLDINKEADLVKRLDQIREENHLGSLQDLEKEVEKQGLIWEDFQDQIRRQLLMQEVIEREVGSRITISREDARKYFDAHREQFASPAGLRLAEILVSTDKRKPEEAEKRAQAALAELKSGAKWEDVVKKYSDNTQTGPEGDIGFFKEGTLAPAAAAALGKLEVHDVSDVIPSQYGYLILRVLEQRSAGVPKFEEVEQQADGVLYNQKIQGALREYLEQLRRESYITLAPGYIDSGAAKAGQTAEDPSQ
jgi:peptidyl-prolyl cis-trans isomerase SurA